MAKSGSGAVVVRAASRRAQRGVALLGLLAVAVMVFAYVLTSRLNAASQFVGIDRDHNAKVLAQAKRALVGWMAINAAGTDANPGRLPCPEAPGDFGTVNEGRAASSCLPPNNVGRLPWRTLGLDKLADADGEPLWYAASPGWSLPGAGTTPINSDTGGQLAFNGENDVALIFAPGAAISVQAGGPCAARSQARPTAGLPDVRDYLECGNETGAYVASVPGQTFNDQVLKVSTGDVLPALEAAIAERIQREIAPALNTVYTNSGYSGIPAGIPMYPYPVPFTDPGTSDYKGQAALCQSPLPPLYLCQGLLPINAASSMVTYASTPGPAVETLGYGYIVGGSQTCSWESTNDVRICEGLYHEKTSEPWRPISIQMTATFTDVAMGLRAIDATRFQVYARDDSGSPPWSPVTTDPPSATMNSDGSVTLTVSATMPNIDVMGWETQAWFRFRLERAVIDDHPVVKTTDATYGWFVRNQWHRLLYYAAAYKNTAGSLSSFGCNNTNCLRFNEGLGCGVGGAEWCNIRALLVLGGASLSNPAGRPNGNLSDYFEYQNGNGGTFYEQHAIRRPTNVAHANGPWNDRVILVDWLPSPSPPLIDVPRSVVIGKHAQVAKVTDVPPRLYVLP